MSQLALKSINELLGKNYFIPSYQRGYRWEKRQVVDLLDDLYSFIGDKNKGENSFYCLQPIVVKECDKEIARETINLSNLTDDCIGPWFEVIDGQQRLTTLYLLFKYLMESNEFCDMVREYGDLYKIFYQTQHGYNECIEKPQIPRSETPNDFYITRAYEAIKNWFESFSESKQKEHVKSLFKTFLLNNSESSSIIKCGYAQVIWYEVDKDVDPIKTFTRLNIGKIPLRNAELIKALFLQKRGKSVSSDVQQINIAKEWDQIEASLQEPRFWAFLNKDLREIPNHIEFIFDVIFAVEGNKIKDGLKDIEYKKLREQNLGLSDKKLMQEAENLAEGKFNDMFGTDEFASFRFFSTKFKNPTRQDIESEWNMVREYYETFSEWQNNPLWYHYIGFLIYCDEPIIDIFNLYKGKTKNEFKQSLINRIKERLAVWVKSLNDGLYELTNEKGEPVIYSNKNRKKLRQILVLYNIEYIIQKNAQLKKSYVIFPFDLFKEQQWDIEHVDSFTTNPLTDKCQQKEWVATSLNGLKDFGINYTETTRILKEEKEKLESFLSEDNSSVKIEDVMWILSKLADEYLPTEEVEKDIKNSIGNLTLLNSSINRSYGNDIFPLKKRTITQKDADGEFIPICTKNVFLKNFIDVNNSPISWSERDMKCYQKNIIEVIYKFLKKDGEGGNNGREI